MPGSPRSNATPEENPARPIHPAALLLACALVGTGLALGRSPLDLAIVSAVACGFALRAEGRSIRAEIPLLLLALVVFLAHAFLSGRPYAEASGPAALIALRLLALLYVLRWAARAFLGSAARWMLALPVPSRPRVLLLPVESAR